MKIGIVYYSLTGNCQFAAEKIKAGIEQCGAADTIVNLIPLKTKKVLHDKGFSKFFWNGKSSVMAESPELVEYSFSANDYDKIIIGFPVWAFTFTPPIRTFINSNPDIKSKRISAFACCSGSADKALNKLKEALGLSSFEEEMVLIDPKDKPATKNDEMVLEFCRKIVSR